MKILVVMIMEMELFVILHSVFNCMLIEPIKSNIKKKLYTHIQTIIATTM